MPRIAEGFGVLALAADLATGRPRGSGLTAAIVAVELAKALGLTIQQQKDAYFLAAVRFIGCTITSHETGMMSFGDDQGFAVATMLGDWSYRADLKAHLDRFIARDAPADERNKAFETICDILPEAALDFTAAHCRQSYLLAKRLLDYPAVFECIPYYYALYDGKILPFGGEDVPYLSRLVRVSEMAELIRRLEDAGKAKAVVEAKAGRELDPNISRVFLEHADEIFASASRTPEFEAFVAAEPGEPIVMTTKCRGVLAEIGADLTDQKSNYFQGHSRRVASLSASAAQILKLPTERIEQLRLAALVHDIGKSAISNRIWYKPTELSISERLEMEGHSYQTEFILSHGPPFSEWAHISSSAQERADGSGYHRRKELPDVACNILAAANEYDELTHGTASRKVLTAEESADLMNKAAADKKYLPTAVTAVLQAAGHKVKKAKEALPFGLTRREAQVLSRLAKSETTAEIAEALDISPKTADHHIQNIYDKTETRGRPAIALLAMEHGIVMD